jgi:hypothetical protein
MSDEQEQVNDLPGQWTKIRGQVWELDTSGLGVLRDLSVEIERGHGEWVVWVSTDESSLSAKGETARYALERVARRLDEIGSDLVEASHELLNG